MSSDTKNVKLGVCKVIYDGADLGYTSGGVEVSVTTDTHEVMVDQFGKTPINEYVLGRHLSVKAPLAESTLENMVKIMPGATLSETGGVAATGTITIATLPVDGETIVVNGEVVTFKTAAAGPLEVTIGADAPSTAAALQVVLSASNIAAIAEATYTVAAAVVTITEKVVGSNGNLFSLGAGSAGAVVTLSGAKLSGGVDPTSKQVSVTSAVGTSLLSLAKVLRLHPIGKPDTDVSDDFVVPLAGTAGALKFAYKLDTERIYDTEFKGYPDPVSGVMFTMGE